MSIGLNCGVLRKNGCAEEQHIVTYAEQFEKFPKIRFIIAKILISRHEFSMCLTYWIGLE